MSKLETAKEARRKSDENLVSISITKINEVIRDGGSSCFLYLPKERKNVIKNLTEMLENNNYKVKQEEHNDYIINIIVSF